MIKKSKDTSRNGSLEGVLLFVNKSSILRVKVNVGRGKLKKIKIKGKPPSKISNTNLKGI